jgi:hypothetical protein
LTPQLFERFIKDLKYFIAPKLHWNKKLNQLLNDIWFQATFKTGPPETRTSESIFA